MTDRPVSAQERLAALLTADAVLRLAHWMVEHLADDQPLGEVWDVIRPAIRTAYEAGAAGVSVPAEPGAPDRETCANCLRVVDEVDAETGECRECYVRFTSQPVPAEPGAPDPWRCPTCNRYMVRTTSGGILCAYCDRYASQPVPAPDYLDHECRDGSCGFASVRHTHNVSSGGVYAWEPVPAPEPSALHERFVAPATWHAKHGCAECRRWVLAAASQEKP